MWNHFYFLSSYCVLGSVLSDSYLRLRVPMAALKRGLSRAWNSVAVYTYDHKSLHAVTIFLCLLLPLILKGSS